jgi:hypothetical protein
MGVGILIYTTTKPLNQNKMETKILDTVYFQPKGINPEYCEAGIILETDKDYIHYLDDPCKILISEVKIIPKENVVRQKDGLIKIK